MSDFKDNKFMRHYIVENK